MEQLLHACLGILTKDIQELSERRFYAVDAARRVIPIRVFLLAVLADGLEVSQMCMQGNQCPCCTAKRFELGRTDVEIQFRSGPEVSLVSENFSPA
jgi:hypothetical protein